MKFVFSGHSGRISSSNLKTEDRFPKFVLNRSQYAFKHSSSAGKRSPSENLPVLKEFLNEYYELLRTNLGKRSLAFKLDELSLPEYQKLILSGNIPLKRSTGMWAACPGCGRCRMPGGAVAHQQCQISSRDGTGRAGRRRG